MEHTDGSLYLVLGGSGGSRIFGAVANVIFGADDVLLKHEHSTDWIDISQAVEAPRAHDQLYPSITELDSIFDQVSLDGLIARGHNVTGKNSGFLKNTSFQHLSVICDPVVQDINRVAAVIQAILVKNGLIFGEYMGTLRARGLFVYLFICLFVSTCLLSSHFY